MANWISIACKLQLKRTLICCTLLWIMYTCFLIPIVLEHSSTFDLYPIASTTIIRSSTNVVHIYFPFTWEWWSQSQSELHKLYISQNQSPEVIFNINRTAVQPKPSWQTTLRDNHTLSNIISLQFRTNHAIHLGYCGPQSYSQFLFVHHNDTLVSYLSVHDVFIKAYNDNALQEDQLYLWIFVVNPFVEDDLDEQLFMDQSYFAKRFFLDTQHLLCLFNFKYAPTGKTVTVLSERVHVPDYLNDRYGFIKCKIPSSIYYYLNEMKHRKYKYTPFHVTLVDPLMVFNNTQHHNTSSNSYITVPLCPNYVTNEGHDLHSNLIEHNKSELKLHKMGSCVVFKRNELDLYAAYDMNQVLLKIDEWIQLAIHIMGVDHFYIYQHIDVSDANEYILYNDLRTKYGDMITFIRWTAKFTVQRMFQVSVMNSCIHQFGRDNEYMILVDMDEVLIPKQWGSTHKTVYDVIHQIDLQHQDTPIAVFTIACNIGITCMDQWGCDAVENGFDSFIQRHQCILNTTDYVWDTNKVIIKPEFVEYQFVHYVSVVRVRIEDHYEYIGKYDAVQSGKIMEINLKNDILCNHMKENPDVLKYSEWITSSPITQHVTNHFVSVRNASFPHLTEHHKVLPLIKDSNVLCNHKH
eukprot:73940_1